MGHISVDWLRLVRMKAIHTSFKGFVARLGLVITTIALLLLNQAVPTTFADAYTTQLVGTSVQGRPIEAYLFGHGPTHIAFIGGIHQGDEANTTALVEQAINYYSDHPNEIPNDITLYLIPDVNPDGHALNQRFNVHGVDLNRNWATDDWKTDTYDVNGLIKGGGGPTPFSEPETAALWKYIQASNLQACIFYHARGGDVVDTLPTAQGTRYSTTLAKNLAWATGYNYLDTWSYYDTSGESSDFLNSKGIYALTVELSGYEDTEWTQNLRGFSEILAFFSPRVFPDTGFSISGRILAFWNSNGGEDVFGKPTGAPKETATETWQAFQKGSLTLNKSTNLLVWGPGADGPVDLPVGGGNGLNTISTSASAGGVIQWGNIPFALPDTIPATDNQTAVLRRTLDNLQNEAHDLQDQFNVIAGQIPGTSVSTTGIGNLNPGIGTNTDINAAPTTSGKSIKVIVQPNSTATVYAYNNGQLIKTIGAFSGMPGYDTPRGQFTIHYKNPSLTTNRWYENEGTEYILNHYVSFTGPSLGYSDDWAFHQMRIPTNGPNKGQMQAGPSHGCLALSPTDAEWIYDWADPGTPVVIY